MGADYQPTFHSPKTSPISLEAINLEWWQPHLLLEKCDLTFEVNLETYRIIEKNNLFQLLPELTNTQKGCNFQPHLPIQITVTLNPEYLLRLQEAAHAETALAYLQELGEHQKNARLVQTESWITLSVQQQQESGVVGYRTLWDYLDWSQLDVENEELLEHFALETVTRFLQDSIPSTLSDANSHQLMATLVEQVPALMAKDSRASEPIAEAFANLLRDNLQSELEEAILAGFSASDNGEEDLDDFNFEGVKKSSILENALAFFESEDWMVEKIPEQPALKLLFQGEYGKWVCLAEVKEDLEQLIFYSMIALKFPKAQESKLCKLLMNINYHLTIGNFDLNFEERILRFKTSIDVENCNNYSPLIKNVVYTNVMTMDRYLPIIMTMLEKKLSLEEALMLL
ncbi:YbjN domain-containing protein [Roseofilum capinflatum]|uniref:YbjN domain-containing protein n=1 Tax=Roseofilum capinflatum BLCC-M114 TaxID=3022440 RepID=A0ABT7B120_9CYAN|nr:YbjN domain-containing protein [Roseofilum capinflatum]MDJ1172860.1 hypothetical protein [Roseofilum capinflatum BLCC-M114]